jgi:hypothetical protein
MNPSEKLMVERSKFPCNHAQGTWRSSSESGGRLSRAPLDHLTEILTCSRLLSHGGNPQGSR